MNKGDIVRTMKTNRTAWLVALMLVALCALPSVAAAGSATYKLLDAASATGAGLKQTYPAIYKDWTCQMNITGAPTEVVVRLEGNLAGSYYTEMITWTLSTDTTYNAITGQGMFGVAGMPARQVRLNIVTITGGTSPRVTGYCAGVE
jgi:hypothetical protein